MPNWKQITPEEVTVNVFDLIGKKWALLTAEKDGIANTMTVSWGQFGHMWNKDIISVVARPIRHTKLFLDGAETFSLCFFREKHRKSLNYLGTVSGKDVPDKIERTGLTLIHRDDTPVFEEAKLIITARKLMALPMTEEAFTDRPTFTKNYTPENLHTIYFGEILSILINEDE